MPRGERVGDNLNRALHALMEGDDRLYILGEDIADPYGGAFRVTRNLSSRFPDRVLSTPLSENGIVGVANGLALCGNRVIVEIMFGDFAGLAFDQVINFASKSVAMYGRRVPMHVLLRCPVGGNRGYGPTHSQSLQKHFIGIPHLSLYELSPFHDAERLLGHMLDRGEPGILFEPKVLYAERAYDAGAADEVLTVSFLGGDDGWAHVYATAVEGPDLVLITSGGMASRALEAARTLAMEDQARVHVLIPAQLYPLNLDPLEGLLAHAGGICVAEESTPGGTWGTEVARHVHERLWGRLARPVKLVNSKDSVIPAAPHLEQQVLVQASTIREALRSLLAAGTVTSAGLRSHPVAADLRRDPAPGVPVRIPKLNNNDVAYLLLRWLAENGQRVQEGDPIAEVETSKAVEELAAALSGTLRLEVPAGADCKPGDVIARLVPAETAAYPVAEAPDTYAGPPHRDARVMMLSRAQRLVASVVTASRRDIPDAFVVLQARVDEVQDLVRKLEEQGDGMLGLLEVLVMAIAGLRARFPACFARLISEDTAELPDEAHVGVTLDAGNGLFVPVVRSVERRAADEIADELAAFRLHALRGEFTEDQLAGANIVVSWNNEPDVVMVQPVIPPGLACAISVGGAQRQVSLNEDGQLVQAAVVNLGLAHDHRLVNGREAIAFLHELAAILQDSVQLRALVSRS